MGWEWLSSDGDSDENGSTESADTDIACHSPPETPSIAMSSSSASITGRSSNSESSSFSLASYTSAVTTDAATYSSASASTNHHDSSESTTEAGSATSVSATDAEKDSPVYATDSWYMSAADAGSDSSTSSTDASNKRDDLWEMCCHPKSCLCQTAQAVGLASKRLTLETWRPESILKREARPCQQSEEPSSGTPKGRGAPRHVHHGALFRI